MEESIAGILENTDAGWPELRGRDELGGAGPCTLTLHAIAVLGPCLTRLVCYILGKGGGMEWVVRVCPEPGHDRLAYLLLVALLDGCKKTVAVLGDWFACALEKVGARLDVIVDDGGRRGGAAHEHLGRARVVVRRRDELARMPCRLRACRNRSARLGVDTLRLERARVD